MYSNEEKPNLSRHTNSEHQTFLPFKNTKYKKPEKPINRKMRVGNKYYGAVVTTTVGMLCLLHCVMCMCAYIYIDMISPI
jgi:hypothetical protein